MTTQPARRPRVSTDADSVRRIAIAEAPALFATDAVNGVIARRDPAELDALMRLLGFLDIRTLYPVTGALQPTGGAAHIEKALDSFFPAEAAKLPLFAEARSQLVRDLVATGELLAEIGDTRAMGFNIHVHPGLPQPAGWHQDGAPVVIVTTYLGAGTEAVSNKDVRDWGDKDPARRTFRDRAIRADAIQQAAPGDRVLLKGTRHPHSDPQGNAFRPNSACVHRSPPQPHRVVAVAYSLKGVG